jgi:hypothetical protein
MADKPADKGLLIYTIKTVDRIAKWNGGESKPNSKFPYEIKHSKPKRMINLYIAARVGAAS